MKRIHMISKACLLIGLAFFTSCLKKTTEAILENPFDSIQSSYLAELSAIERHMDSIASGYDYRKHLAKSRKLFKQAELVLAFAETGDFKSLNRPNILAVKEEDKTDVKVLKPLGLQVMEELIYEDEIDSVSVIKNASFVKSRAAFLQRNTNFSHYKDYHFLKMIRDQIIRIATTGITGFDSPVLSNSIEESKITYQSILKYLQLYKSKFEDKTLYDRWINELEKTIEDLNGDFESFDRYSFIKDHTDKQFKIWNETVIDWKVSFNLTFALNNEIESLFSENSFNKVHFSDRQADAENEEKLILGRKLFNDNSLSKDGKFSCASCHDKSRAFTDGLVLAKGQKRNSPTLTYAGLQKEFFYDNREGSLEGQIVSVINSESEFHTTAQVISEKVSENPDYKAKFDSLYKKGATDYNIRNAIANYIRSLAPFDSKFDRNIRGEEETLTSLEVKGFNIFMGKGSCATCHFPPVFNGTVPPDFQETEMELIGVPETSENLAVDDDLGRYDIFHTEERKFFFKTPTVRNASLTAPYMHNGVYETLEEVMDFYNKGGGAGMGFDLPGQTLPFDSLGLTNEEQQAVVAFMEALTDKTE